MINPKIAPKLPEEQTRVPVPDWMRRLQAAYSQQHARRPRDGAVLAGARAGDRARQGARSATRRSLTNFGYRAGAVRAGRRHARGRLVVRRHPPAGGRADGRARRRSSSSARRRRAAPRRRADAGPADGLLLVASRHRCVLGAAHARALLLRAWTPSASRSLKLLDLLGHAARHPDRDRAGGHPVRHHDGDRIGRGRRRRRLPARLPGAHARLEADQGGGVPHRQDHRDGVLAVRRLGAVLGGVRASSAVRRWSSNGCCRST